MEIKSNGKLYAKLINIRDCKKGQQWHSENADFLQVSTWRLSEGHHLQDHVHKIRKRESDITQEVIVVMSGRVKCNVFDENARKITDFIIEPRGFAIFYRGGHGFEILDNGSNIIEVKNGPFVDVESDKSKI